jgi:hypothetical protein
VRAELLTRLARLLEARERLPVALQGPLLAAAEAVERSGALADPDLRHSLASPAAGGTLYAAASFFFVCVCGCPLQIGECGCGSISEQRTARCRASSPSSLVATQLRARVRPRRPRRQ